MLLIWSSRQHITSLLYNVSKFNVRITICIIFKHFYVKKISKLIELYRSTPRYAKMVSKGIDALW